MADQITIIGAGFAALTAVKTIRKRSKDAEITLIAPQAEFVYLPGLIWIPSGLRTASDLTIDLQRFFKRHKVKFHQGAALKVSEDGRMVGTDQGDVSNDALLIACGGRFIKKLPGIENVITICEGISAAERMRDRLKEIESGTIALGFGGNPKEPSAMRGGPMFELLLGLDTQLRQEKRRDKFEIIFFSPAPQPGKRLGEGAVEALLSEMDKRDIKTHLGHKMKGFEANKVMTEGGDINADLILFMPGMTGPALAQPSGFPLSSGGLIAADKYCQVEGYDKVYVAGDSGSYPGPDWQPKQAHMADLQAVAAANNLLDAFVGKQASHTFKFELICIIDSLTKGAMVFRNRKRTILLPQWKILHTAKRFFEWWYLRSYH